MHPQEAIAFWLFALAVAGTPGPSNVLVMTAGAQSGVVAGLRCLAGVVAGMAMLLAVAALGLAGVLHAVPAALVVLRVLGSAFLLWLAWQVAMSPHPAAGSSAPVVGFWRAFAFQWINPKSWVVGASAAGTFAGGDEALSRALAIAGVFAAAAAPACGAWLLGGALLQEWLREGRRWRMFQRAMGLALAVSVAMLWV